MPTFERQLQGAFARVGEDLRSGDTIQLLDAGTLRDFDYGGKQSKKWVFQARVRGEERLIKLNGASINNMIEAFGGESEDWVGEDIKVWVVKVLIADRIKNVVYYSHPEADMQEDTSGRIKFILPKEFVKVKKPEDATGA